MQHELDLLAQGKLDQVREAPGRRLAHLLGGRPCCSRPWKGAVQVDVGGGRNWNMRDLRISVETGGLIDRTRD